MSRWTRVFIVAAIGLMVAGHGPEAWACSCAAPAGDYEARRFNAADAVFIGTAVERRRVSEDESSTYADGTYAFVFDVSSVQKGSVRDPEMVRGDNSSCDFFFRIGERYQIFATATEEGFTTAQCTGTRWLAAAEAYYPDELPDSGVVPRPLVAVALMLTAIVAAVTVARAR